MTIPTSGFLGLTEQELARLIADGAFAEPEEQVDPQPEPPEDEPPAT